ncbi:MAG TPA: inositol 2-dehydrogenase [Rectinemataceae bacterium]|nr:inositol 2-dehydrogenase [Rectinemataceae bacterium]
MSKTIRVGIIGAGRIGKIHAENIAYFMPNAKLAAIADLNMTPAMEGWATGLGVQSVLKDPAALLSDASIDAVLICSSTDTHADFVVKAAQAGKHIFCEKPVDLTVAKVRSALDAVRKAGVKLQVGFNRRFDHNFRRIRELVESGAVGQPQLVKITSRDPAPPPPAYVAVSGGIFLDMTIHDFDMARYQAGSEVVEVYAAGAVLVDEGIGKAGDVDTAIVTLRFANGALGVIDNSRKAAYGYDQRVEVFGSRGAATAENDAPSTVRVSNESGVTGDKPLYFFLERYKDAFIAEMRAFLDAVAENKPCPVTGEDGLQDLLVALAAKKSLAERRPVTMAEMTKE